MTGVTPTNREQGANVCSGNHAGIARAEGHGAAHRGGETGALHPWLRRVPDGPSRPRDCGPFLPPRQFAAGQGAGFAQCNDGDGLGGVPRVELAGRPCRGRVNDIDLEAGWTDAEIQTVTGQSLEMVAFYRKDASARVLSKATRERRE